MYSRILGFLDYTVSDHTSPHSVVSYHFARIIIIMLYRLQFGLLCEENKWKLSMVGTVNNFGQFIGIPMSGIIADK